LVFIHNKENHNEKPRNSQDLQRLSGLNTLKIGVCDSPNHFERNGRGNNKTSRHRNMVIKVTDRRETQDVLQRDSLEATASVVNCVGGSNGDLPTEMAVSDIDDIVAVLQGNDGEYITNMIGGENKCGTSPIGDSYGMMCSTRMIPVLNNMAGFVRKFQYPNIDKTLESEWGGINNVRAFVSSQGSVTQNASLLGNDVANCFVTAKEGYKVVKMLDHYKSSLIDLEAYDCAIAA
jgi:N4-gp56 family major capsid protein